MISAACLVEFEFPTKISAGIRSDYSVVDAVGKASNKRRRHGLWRYNNQLHESDSVFVELVREKIGMARSASQPYTADISISVRVEMLLSHMRVICIQRGKTIAYELRKEERERELVEKVTELEKDVSRSGDVQRDVYSIARNRLDAIKTKRGVQTIIASGAKWTVEGEKATRYFLNKGKPLSALKTIVYNEDL